MSVRDGEEGTLENFSLSPFYNNNTYESQHLSPLFASTTDSHSQSTSHLIRSFFFSIPSPSNLLSSGKIPLPFLCFSTLYCLHPSPELLSALLCLPWCCYFQMKCLIRITPDSQADWSANFIWTSLFLSSISPRTNRWTISSSSLSQNVFLCSLIVVVLEGLRKER